MNNHFNRRRFLQSAFASSLLYGSGAIPTLISSAQAMPAPLNRRMLANLNLSGGPDMRHLIVPAYDPSDNTFGGKYWKHRWRSHRLVGNDSSTWQQRWNDDYYPITVSGSGWNAGLADVGSLNTGVTFGIWREAGWLIDMFRSGHVALIFNAVGGKNRAHDLSSLMLAQGNVLSTQNDKDRSGWGGRVARSAGGNSLSLTSSPSTFSFGPLGSAPNYNPDRIDNQDLISVKDARNFGLFDFDISERQYNNNDYKMARAAKSYYAGLRNEVVSQAYQKFLDHESTIREFGDLVKGRLATVPIPYLIDALRNGIDDPNGNPINPEPDITDSDYGEARRVLRSTGFGTQIRNLYDVIAANDLLDTRVASLSYGGWDSHGTQRQVPAVLSTDPNNPYQNRGIENGLRDIFGGQFGTNPIDSNALHCGFSALWKSLEGISGRQNLVLTVAGEFGRQIRDNGDLGTDHGKGNLMLVIGESVRGGIYGEMFPDTEIDKYDNASLRTPDIDPRTEIDQFFSQVADWIAPGSAASVFPRMASGYSGDAPDIELAGMFDSLMIS